MSKFRLYPTKEQAAALLEHCAHARFVYNLALEQRMMWRRWQGPSPDLREQGYQLTEARAAEPWLAAGSVIVQQQALRDHDQAWKDYWRGIHGKPTWRKRHRNEGFRIVSASALRLRQDNAKWSSVLVPKVGWVKFRRTRAVPEYKSYRVKLDPYDRWHITFVAIPKPIPGPGTGEIVGVDRGVAVGAALSTGELTSPRPLSPKEAERFLRLQRRTNRGVKDSGQRERLRRSKASLRARAVDRRRDWSEKTSTDIARRFDLIRIEDLKIMRITKSAKGTVDAPGSRVSRKTGMNRAIRSMGWGHFADRLQQKAPGRVEKVPPAYTSKICNSCGHCAKENRESQAVFLCVACGHQDHADVNAAKNIADGRTAVGYTVAARGDLGMPGSMKREPQPLRPSA